MSIIGPALNGIIPVICVTLAGLACLLAEAFRQRDERMPIGGLGAIGLAGAAAAVVLLWGRRAESFGVVRADDFGLFVQMVLLGVGLLTIVFSPKAIERDNLPAGEYYALVLFAIAGMMLMAVATDLLVIFLALEVFSLALYVLTGLRRHEYSSTEGAFKYFVLGGFASAFFLYGIAFTYGLVGSTHLDRVASAVEAQALSGNPLLLVAMGLLLVGLAFKVAAVPFHMWTPDAYEAAPTVITGFMSTAVKAAGFAVFVRVFLLALEPLRAEWMPVVWVLAVCTMVLGSVVGVAQTNLKRMLAYSSIAHGGYLLVAVIAGGDMGRASILFYLVVYAITNVGAFAVLALLSTRDAPMEHLDDYRGLWHSNPAIAGLLTIFLLSLGGFPPTAGFVAKWFVFSAAVGAGQFSLAIIGVLTSVVSVFFYLRIVVMMYMAEKQDAASPPRVPPPALAALSLSAAVLFYLGVLPTRVLELAARSVAGMF
ncbi:MAG TPA: NADH-quinone oxidoreductase subunit N [Vicinamibacterales bacterium]|nr:NADH-quinone oxidoreductase subunit N [Vicinamibacterales bacterium]